MPAQQQALLHSACGQHSAVREVGFGTRVLAAYCKLVSVRCLGYSIKPNFVINRLSVVLLQRQRY